VKIYRLTQARFAQAAFEGIGALRFDGRWHRAGRPLVCAADTPAGALLEVLVHTEAAALLSHAYARFVVRLGPERHLLRLRAEQLPPEWSAPIWPRATQEIGARWLADEDSAILEVPSAVIAGQHNYLINPRHPLFGELSIEGPEPFRVDPRLGPPAEPDVLRQRDAPGQPPRPEAGA
jgi:RES domain-containing protein